MNPEYLKVGTFACPVCGELIEKRRKVDGTFRKRQPRYCSYQCWYRKEGSRLQAERHAQREMKPMRARKVWEWNGGKPVMSYAPKRWLLEQEKAENPGPGITCPRCGRVSYNASDVIYRYCGHCQQFHDLMVPKRNDVR